MPRRESKKHSTVHWTGESQQHSPLDWGKSTAQSLGLGKFSGLPGVLNLPAKVELPTCIKTHTPASDKYAGGPRRETPYQAQYRGEIIAYRMLAQTDRLIPMDESSTAIAIENRLSKKYMGTNSCVGLMAHSVVGLLTMVKRAWFSHWYGWRMDRPASAKKIAPFIEEYDLIQRSSGRGSTSCEFQQIFYRQLKPARPIDPDPDSVVFPADGRHLCIPDIPGLKDCLSKARCSVCKTFWVTGSCW